MCYIPLPCDKSFVTDTVKFPKFWDARKLWCNHPKSCTKRSCHWVDCPKDANSEDPEQTAPREAV